MPLVLDSLPVEQPAAVGSVAQSEPPPLLPLFPPLPLFPLLPPFPPLPSDPLPPDPLQLPFEPLPVCGVVDCEPDPSPDCVPLCDDWSSLLLPPCEFPVCDWPLLPQDEYC